jgi:gamma-glutamyl-gamma-aminobutyrate hydrolase PuuD
VVVGLTTYVERAQQGVWDVPAAYLQYQYVESVTRVGGIATLLPPQPVSAEAVDAVLDRVDALVRRAAARRGRRAAPRAGRLGARPAARRARP